MVRSYISDVEDCILSQQRSSASLFAFCFVCLWFFFICCHNTVQAMGCDLVVGDGSGTCTIEWYYGGNNDSCPVAVDKSEGVLFISW